MKRQNNLIDEIKSLIVAYKEAAIRSVDHQRVLLYWKISQKIFEEEQGAKDQADYGAYLTKYFAAEPESVYGSGFSKCQLELFQQFCRTFPIANAVRSQFSWTHYRIQ